MKLCSVCLFSQIPHTTRLFADFLAYSGDVRKFYPHSAHFGEWFRDVASGLRFDPQRRERVAAVLERQNRAFGASDKTLGNIALGSVGGAAAVVTGQQVALFGGPMFSIFKALTAVKLAEEASRAGVDCVPVFWLATQDHDLAEVGSCIHLPIRFSPSPPGIRVLTHGAEDAPVGTIVFGPRDRNGGCSGRGSARGHGDRPDIA